LRPDLLDRAADDAFEHGESCRECAEAAAHFNSATRSAIVGDPERAFTGKQPLHDRHRKVEIGGSRLFLRQQDPLRNEIKVHRHAIRSQQGVVGVRVDLARSEMATGFVVLRNRNEIGS
jgi:hypothetical protein